MTTECVLLCSAAAVAAVALGTVVAECVFCEFCVCVSLFFLLLCVVVVVVVVM